MSTIFVRDDVLPPLTLETEQVFQTLSVFSELLFPVACVGCGVAGVGLCAACRPRQPMTRLHLPGVDVYAADSYLGALRTLLIRYKERRQIVLAHDLAEILLEPLRALECRAGVFVPVPSQHSATRVRGGNHVERLARVAAQMAGDGGQVAEPVKFARQVRESVGLSRPERRLNLLGSMVALTPAECGLVGGPHGAEVVIVDDLVTTGASLIETARALRMAGWNVRGAAVVASTPRHGDPQRREIVRG